ncbi:MAG: TRAP transporter large permease subunit [Rhodospirillaceae bacterium]|jgi:tripartite ATP-independent transporter DctM subunit|nr:TRAP transporter large permease subunit [Rhodospirillaceae bacterium]MBT6137970.1 TRAP transporter large permease subunit [Rhodospirillaceae bacterium]
MSIEIGLMMFPALMIAIFIGFPVAFSLMGIAVIFGYFRFGDALVHQLVAKVDDVASYYVLAAVPLFIFMGMMLEKSGIAVKLFEAIHLWTRRLPGGLAVGTVLICVVFAAASGVIGATESVVGLLAIPVMLKYAYDKGLIAGTICAGGSLGTIIPPSIVVIILAPVADISVGDLFVGMLFPGLILAGLFILYILVRCIIWPEDGPRIPRDEHEMPLRQKLWLTATALVPPLVLIFAVLGTIMLGWATPTEAAAVGAIGTVIMTMIYRTFSFSVLHDAMVKTLQVTAMILFILLGGTMFSGVFVALGGISAVQDALSGANLSAWTIMLSMLALAFVAGFVLDLISIILIIIPIAVELLRSMGVDIVWFCIMFLIMIQTSYLTPPMAPAIFYLRGISPPEIKLTDMYRGVVPFIALEFVVLAMVAFFPGLALWLPSVVFAQ